MVEFPKSLESLTNSTSGTSGAVPTIEMVFLPFLRNTFEDFFKPIACQSFDTGAKTSSCNSLFTITL